MRDSSVTHISIHGYSHTDKDRAFETCTGTSIVHRAVWLYVCMYVCTATMSTDLLYWDEDEEHDLADVWDSFQDTPARMAGDSTSLC